MRMRLLLQAPLLGEGGGHLADFGVVEWLFENQPLFLLDEPADDVGPTVVGIGRADDGMNIGVDLPEVLDRFQAVPAWRHTHVYESQREGSPLSHGVTDFVKSFFSLERELDVVTAARRGRRVVISEHRCFEIAQAGVGIFRAEDFAEVVVNGSIVIDNQNSTIQLRGFTIHLDCSQSYSIDTTFTYKLRG